MSNLLETAEFQSKSWKWAEYCYMIADTPEELISIALRMGLKLKWMTPGVVPHFDLTKYKRKQAISFGAVEKDVMDLAKISVEIKKGEQ